MSTTLKSLSISYRVIASTTNRLIIQRSISTVQRTPLDNNEYHEDFRNFGVGSYRVPSNYNLPQIVNEIKNGQGFFVLKGAFSQRCIEEAKDLVDYFTENKRVDTNTDTNEYAKHNSYGGEKKGGIIWRLLGKGAIFEKLAQHPATLEITRELLGPKSQISSYMSNTVLPGMGAQLPHLDYPYYDGFFPNSEADIQRPLLSVAFMIMLSEFTIENGGTAFRPGSQRKPTYPHDREDFYRNMVQLQGEPGDIGIFAASTQHCAMQNNGKSPRVGIVQSMVPVYMKPYHDIKLPEDHMSNASDDMKKLLAYGHPYPMQHG